MMTGMELMSDSVAGLKDNAGFGELMVMFSNPILGVLLGAVVTAIIQSSSASVGILQALSSTGSIPYMTVVPIVLGQNIGTCVTAIISSIGANKSAKRVAAVHLSFNILGSLLFLLVFTLIKSQLPILNDAANEFGIAIVHSIFNIFATVVLFPFNKMLEKIACKIVPDVKGEDDEINLLDERLLQTPALAVSQCRRVSDKMVEVAHKSILKALDLIKDFDEDGFEFVKECEDKTDKFEDSLGTYLVKLTQRDLPLEESREVTELLYLIGDIERMGDHALNIAEAAEEIYEKKIKFTEEGENEIRVLCEAVREIVDLAIKTFNENDVEAASSTEALEQVIDNLKSILKNNHVKRLREGRCTIETGFVFSDIITNCERISDHCSNVAVCVTQLEKDNYSGHEYLNIKHSDEDYKAKVEEYSLKYSI